MYTHIFFSDKGDRTRFFFLLKLVVHDIFLKVVVYVNFSVKYTPTNSTKEVNENIVFCKIPIVVFS